MTNAIERLPGEPYLWTYRDDVALLLRQLRMNMEAPERWPHDALVLLTGGFSSELGRRWFTADEVFRLYQERKFEHDLFGCFEEVAVLRGKPVDAEFLDNWFELYKGIEYEGEVLMRTSERPYRWGVVCAEEGGDGDDEQCGADDLDTLLAALAAGPVAGPISTTGNPAEREVDTGEPSKA